MFNLDKSWLKYLSPELEKPYMKNIEAFLQEERALGKIIYPSKENIFRSLNITKFDDIKVVIIGQDPYHQEGQANGLSFSVGNEVKIPPSLQNIFKELSIDLDIDFKKTGDLTNWARQGILLLNSILTVEKGKPSSHYKIGWQIFTDKIIRIISSKKKDIIFLLWGKYAEKKEEIIDLSKHYILKTSHPSPLSAYKGFLGSKCFSKMNSILKQVGKDKINW